jgi:anhydro-N-acetylmuramic acid kinase
MKHLSKHDQIATLTEFTARSLVLNYQLHLPGPPRRVILAGGGAANPKLVDAIQQHLQAWNASIAVRTCDELGWPVQSIEPAAFALLAHQTWHRKPGNLPETTGARRSVVLGQITQPG